MEGPLWRGLRRDPAGCAAGGAHNAKRMLRFASTEEIETHMWPYTGDHARYLVVNRTYGTHKNLYISIFLYEHLVRCTLAPRNRLT